MEKKDLVRALNDLQKENDFQKFSEFIILKMSGRTEFTDEVRREEYQSFRKKTNHYAFASLPTMKRWFGIGGEAMPNRMQIYQICLKMELSEKDAEDFFRNGLHEPVFQINDFREVIYRYGLANHKELEECEKLMEAFELSLEPMLSFEHKTNTQKMFFEFEQKKSVSLDEFMDWMKQHAVDFKGYSKTTLHYFERYRKRIFRYIKQDAMEELNRLLAETDYGKWEKRQLFSEKDKKQRIKKYLDAQNTVGTSAISEDLRKNILEWLNIAYLENESNYKFLAEMYESTKMPKKTNSRFPEIKKLTAKRYSDLLNAAVHKEQYFHVMQAKNELKGLSENAACPEWIHDMVKQYGGKETVTESVAEAKKWVKDYLSEHRRRCIEISRNDLLPLILYVAQRNYLEEIRENMENYEKRTAVQFFEELANSTLVACYMEPLNKTYVMDAVLYQCYQEEEMFLFSDVLEVLYGADE